MQIYIIIETSLLLEGVSKPNLDPKKPISISEEYIYIVKAGETNELIGLEKNEIKIKKELVEEISFYAVSESSNFDNPVILYDLKSYDDDNILEELSVSQSKADTIIPERFDPLETRVAKRTFLTCKSKVLDTGKGKYGIHFAIFNYDFVPQGYFEFVVNITIE